MMLGIFDSGVGGLSVMKEVALLLPCESVCYVADTAHCPYGPRPSSEVLDLSLRATRFMLRKGCQLIMVACNTATAAAIDELRRGFADVPFVGMEPAVKPAAERSQTQHVGILATAGTVRGRLFAQTSARVAHRVQLHVAVGKGLVELVEAGREDSPEAVALLTEYLQPMLDCGVDQLVLGCTHYPFLLGAIERVVQGRMTILNPAPAVAAQAQRLLEQRHLLAPATTPPPRYDFYSTGDAQMLAKMVGKHLAEIEERCGFESGVEV
jgi:glutamate racemase